jgi:hypothetical protein
MEEVTRSIEDETLGSITELVSEARNLPGVLKKT